MHISIHDQTRPGDSAEDGYAAGAAHIRRVYRQVFDARVTELPPRLVSARAPDGTVLCVAGIRTGADGFFSQTYLDRPVRDVLSQIAGTPVADADILEVVSMAATSPFPMLPVLDTIVTWGRERQIAWGIFTATDNIRRLVNRAGLTCTPLVQARPDRVATPGAWGSYYAQNPWVCAFQDTRGVLPQLARRTARCTAAIGEAC